MIEGWDIDALSATGITVVNTTAHFVIRGIYVHSDGWSYDGVLLWNVTNGRVEGAVIEATVYGIYVYVSRDVTVASNRISWSGGDGINVDTSSGITLTGNDVQFTAADGVYAYATTGLSVQGNRISGGSWVGMSLQLVDGASVTGNNVSGNNLVGGSPSTRPRTSPPRGTICGTTTTGSTCPPPTTSR